MAKTLNIESGMSKTGRYYEIIVEVRGEKYVENWSEGTNNGRRYFHALGGVFDTEDQMKLANKLARKQVELARKTLDLGKTTTKAVKFSEITSVSDLKARAVRTSEGYTLSVGSQGIDSRLLTDSREEAEVDALPVLVKYCNHAGTRTANKFFSKEL